MKRTIFFAICAFMVQQLEAVDGDTFKSQTVGFEITKPKNWRFASAQENLENIKRTELSDENLKKLILKSAAAPLVVITKFTEPYDDLNPSLKVSIKPYGTLKGKTPAQILDLILPTLSKAFKDFALADEPAEVEMFGIKSAHMGIEYTLVAENKAEFESHIPPLDYPQRGLFFLGGSRLRRDEKNGSYQEIEAILDTVKIGE